MKTRIAASIMCTAALAFGAFGCGGGDDDSPDGGNDFAEQPAAQQEAQKEVAKFVAGFVASVRAGDAQGFCSHFEPGAVEETFGSPDRCADTFAPLLKQSKLRGQFEIGDLQFEGDRATVTFKGGKGQGDLEQVDGKWYIEIPEGVAEQVKGAEG